MTRMAMHAMNNLPPRTSFAARRRRSMPGRPDEARKLLRTGLAPRARRSDAQPSAGGGAVFPRRDSAGPRPCRDQPDQAARQCRRASACRPHRARRQGFRRRACRIWIAPSRSRRSARPFSKRRGRWTRPVYGRRRARPGGRSWKSFRSIRRPRPGSDGWHGRMATTPSPRLCSNAPSATTRPPRSGSISASRARICAISGAAAAYRKAIEHQADHAEAALNLGIVLQEAGDLERAMRAYARSLSAASRNLRHHRDGADLGARTAGCGSTRHRCAAHSAADPFASD